MSLHRLTSVTMGVPNVAETVGYYTEFGLRPEGDGWFATRDGGRQLRVVPAATRRPVELHIGVGDPPRPGSPPPPPPRVANPPAGGDAPAALAGVAARLTSMGVSPRRTAT